MGSCFEPPAGATDDELLDLVRVVVGEVRESWLARCGQLGYMHEAACAYTVCWSGGQTGTAAGGVMAPLIGRAEACVCIGERATGGTAGPGVSLMICRCESVLLCVLLCVLCHR